MNNRLLNYTTEVPVDRTIAEIQQTLAGTRATSILTEYEDGDLHAIMFKVRGQHGQELPYLMVAGNRTLFEEVQERQFQLTAGSQKEAQRA